MLPQQAAEYLPQLAELVSAGGALQGFDAADKLRESLWRALPRIGQAIGEALSVGLSSPARDDSTRRGRATNECLRRVHRPHAGKQLLKRHLEPFLKPLFDDLAATAAAAAGGGGGGLAISSAITTTPQVEAAAGKAVGALRDLLGANIFAARLTEAQRAVLATSDAIPAPQGRPASSLQALLGRMA